VADVATIVNIDVMLAKRKMSVTELAKRVGITLANLSILKNGKARGIRFSTLEGICRALDCQPGDILEYRSDDTQSSTGSLATGDTESSPQQHPSNAGTSTH
jgi:putative transcriptional regulator